MSKKTKLTRRKFLTGAGILAGGTVGAGALAVPVFRDPELQAAYPVVDSNKVELAPNGKSVIVIGGGLAGLQAGVELSARGFKVIILEKSGTPGGKLKSWRDKGFGPADMPEKSDPSYAGIAREHGLHAVWGFYNNLREFMHRYGWALDDPPKEATIYHFLDKDGTKSTIPNTTWPLPYNYLQMALASRQLRHLDEKDRGEFSRLYFKLASFDYADPKQRAYLDGMTFEEYGKRLGLPDSLIHKICDSIIEMAYFDNVDKATALTFANLMQLVAGSPDDLKVSLYLDPPGETFLQPMVDYITAHGGELHYNTEITSLQVDGKTVRGVTAQSLDYGKLRRCSICGNLIYEGMEVTDCPFCGANGDMIMYLQPEEMAERTFTADYYISALDIPAAQQFFGANIEALGDDPYFAKIQNLTPKSVYVVNMWFEGQGSWTRRFPNEQGKSEIVFFATGFKHLGITINRGLAWKYDDGKSHHHFGDYAGREVSVIETQIAKAEAVANMTTEEIGALCYAELKEVFPDLPPYKSIYVNRWHHYTGYHVGDEGNRPPIQSPLDNLLLIGDMAFVPHPGVFMEKTNVTAKWATNLILEKAGQSEGRIRILPSGTRNPLLTMLKQLQSVYV